jgi:ABC-type transporter Mla subunit MlaD
VTATIAGQPDPVIGVLDSLSSAAGTVGALNAPITEVQEIVSVVDSVLDDLDRLPTLLDGIEELLVGLRGLLVLLDAVPFVDAAAAAGTEVVTVAQELLAEATEAFAEVDESVIKPCRAAFDDLKPGLTEAQNVVHTISLTIPGYVNTLEILHFMAEIAAPLAEILEGSKPADDLRNLLDTLTRVEEDVGTALKPLADFLDGMRNVVADISHSLDAVFHEMQDTMQAVEAGLQGVEGIFDPVVDAFNAVADAIKPIRWALDAISWIFDHVCEPILESILDATGLNTLLDGLEAEVEQKLGIKPIIDLVKSNLNSQAAGGWKQQGGTQAAGSGQSAWDTFSGVLKQYNTRDSGGFKKDVDLLISALAGTPIAPGTPALIPDWPDQPGLQVPTVGPAPKSVGAAANASDLGMPLQQTPRAMRLAQGFQALAAIPSKAPPTPRLDVAASVLGVAIAGLIAKGDDIVTALEQAFG